jgi:lysophospholipase L1-like esterase
MKYFYLYIFGLVCFIITMAYWNTLHFKEAFNPNSQYFLLLGDSILNNQIYVSKGKSVNELLYDSTNKRTINLAKNEATIQDVYNQIAKIPDNLKSSSDTTIFLSVGGNDILFQSTDNNKGQIDSKVLNTIFSAYKPLIKTIKTIMPNSQIVPLDIYYPDNIKYRQYHKVIREWNEKLYDYAKNNHISVLRISDVLFKPEDFTLGIEPSEIGGEKIVKVILENY